MKRILLCLLMILSLCACSGSVEETPPAVPSEIKASVTVTCFNCEYTADLSVGSNSDMTATIKEPKELKGVMLSFNSDGCTLSCNGMELKYSDSIEKKLPFDELYRALAEAKSRAPDECSKSGFNYEMIYKSAEYEFTVFMNSENGKIFKVKTDRYVFHIE